MGWLRDYMTTVDPPIQSFGKLAQSCLLHPHWPSHLALKYRSLSTLFSKFDHSRDLDWLRDRIEVQQVLADLLGRPLGDIRTSIGETPSSTQTRFLRFLDVRYARDLDLTREDLPPGIPRTVTEPPTWEPTWWHAPSGSGRSLVAAWLEARGLAHARQVRSRADLEQLPSRGPLFLEVDASLSENDLIMSLDDWKTLGAFRRPVCVAATFPPPADGAEKFATVTSPEPSSYIPELVDWVDQRLDDDGQFRADRVETWMLKVAVPSGAVTCFGDALGLLGMADEIPLRSLLAKSLDELGAHFVERRLREVSEQSSLGPKNVSEGFLTLQRCAARVLVTGQNALRQAHPLDEWTALLATPEQEDAPDPEWFVTALGSTLGKRVSGRDLRRAARKLPPSAYQLTRALEAARLLVRAPQHLARDEHGAERSLHPRFLVSLLEARAAQQVLTFSPHDWGRVLLLGKEADRIIEGLMDAARRDRFDSYFALVDHYEADLPSHAAALEGAIVALGLVSLEGVDPPDELVDGLFSLLGQEIFVENGFPEPRLTCSPDKAVWFTRTNFLVSFAALCTKIAFPLAHLDPLRAANVALTSHFTSACNRLASERWPTIDLRVGLLETLEQLVSHLPDESSLRPASTHLLSAFTDASAETFQQALTAYPAEVFVRALTARRVPEADVYDAFCRHAGLLRNPGRLFLTEEGERAFYRHAPVEILLQRTLANLPVPYEVLLPHQFAEWLKSDVAPPLSAEAAHSVPLDPCIAAIDTWGTRVLSDEGLTVIAKRAPLALAERLATWCRDGQAEEVERLLSLADTSCTPAFVQRLPRTALLLSAPPRILRAVRAFLLRAVRGRHTTFEECFLLLSEIERGVGTLRQLP